MADASSNRKNSTEQSSTIKAVESTTMVDDEPNFLVLMAGNEIKGSMMKARKPRSNKRHCFSAHLPFSFRDKLQRALLCFALKR